VVEQYEYDPFGKATVYTAAGALVDVGPAGTSPEDGTRSAYGLTHLYKAMQLDPETGNCYVRNRFYDPRTGRFMSRDPIGVWGDGGNMGNEYAYAWNRPLEIGDPMGTQVTAWIGGALEGRGGNSMANAMNEHRGVGPEAGVHGYFPDRGEEGTDEAIIDWVEEQYADQLLTLTTGSVMKSEGCQIQVAPTITLIGHSLGGAQAKRVTKALAAKGIAVDFLVTIDPVGSEDTLVSLDQVFRWNAGSLDCPTHWVNVYNLNFADAVVDVPIPVVSHFVGGLLGGLFAAINGDDVIAGLAQAGDRWGSESGAANYELDVGHENASSYLDHALKSDSTLRAGLVGTGILR
jgi:RHS repeat-associated protein